MKHVLETTGPPMSLTLTIHRKKKYIYVMHLVVLMTMKDVLLGYLRRMLAYFPSFQVIIFYLKKKQREHEKETRTKKEAEQSEFRTAGYDMWSRMEPQNEKLMAAMQQLSLKERFVVTEYVLKGKPFKEIAQETGLKEKGVASAYYRSIKKLRAEMGDVK